MAYAKNTTVPVERTIGEIRKALEKAGADGFAFAEQGGCAYIIFKINEPNGRSVGVKIFLRMPRPPERTSTEASKKTWEQVRKSKWRSLLLCIKAKTEAIESGIETFEEAFLPHIVLSNGQTVGHKIIPKIEELNQTPPALLLGL
jgi:hypothetical protein